MYEVSTYMIVLTQDMTTFRPLPETPFLCKHSKVTTLIDHSNILLTTTVNQATNVRRPGDGLGKTPRLGTGGGDGGSHALTVLW